MDETGAHVLVGIVSRGDSCDQQDYSVFTSVSGLLPWIESSIKENGGMASCTFNFSAPPTLGILHSRPQDQGDLVWSDLAQNFSDFVIGSDGTVS